VKHKRQIKPPEIFTVKSSKQWMSRTQEFLQREDISFGLAFEYENAAL